MNYTRGSVPTVETRRVGSTLFSSRRSGRFDSTLSATRIVS